MQLFGNHSKGKAMKKLFGLVKISSLPLFFFAFSIPAFAAYDGSKRISDLNPPPCARMFVPQTYRVVVAGFAPALDATDILVIQGSATKTIRITYYELTATATAAAEINLHAYKRMAANTGGTSTLQTAIPLGSTTCAATATASLYTAKPSVLGAGELVDGESPVLHGADQSVAISADGVTLPAGAKLYITVEWTEE
jgi:hypothetical protein